MPALARPPGKAPQRLATPTSASGTQYATPGQLSQAAFNRAQQTAQQAMMMNRMGQQMGQMAQQWGMKQRMAMLRKMADSPDAKASASRPQAVGARPVMKPASVMTQQPKGAAKAVAKPYIKFPMKPRLGGAGGGLIKVQPVGKAPGNPKAAPGIPKAASAASMPAKPSGAASEAATSKGPIEKRDPAEIKGEVKMRKVEAMTKQLLDEWLSLDEERKLESWKNVMEKFTSRVPGKYLVLFAEKAYSDVDPDAYEAANQLSIDSPAKTTSSNPVKKEMVTSSGSPAEKMKQGTPSKPVAKGPAEKSAVEKYWGPSAKSSAEAKPPTTPPPEAKRTKEEMMVEVKARLKNLSKFEEAMTTVLQAERADWLTVWTAQKITNQDQPSALAALGQAAAESGEIDNVCALLVNLADNKKISTSSIETALAAISSSWKKLSRSTSTLGIYKVKYFITFFRNQRSATGGSLKDCGIGRPGGLWW